MIKKNLKFIIPAILLFLGLLFYFVTINYTTLYVDNNYSENNYLSIDELTLRNRNNKKVGQFPSDGESDYLSDYKEYDYITSKGIKVGDKIEDFVKVYGDYNCLTVHATYYNYEDNSSSHNSEMYQNIKVKDFYEEYIETGLIDIDKYEVTFDFNAYVCGNKIGFTELVRDDMSMDRYNSFWPRGGIFNPRLQRYNLSFSFVMVDGKYVLEYLSTYHYAY